MGIKENAIKRVQQEQKYVMTRLTALMNWVSASSGGFTTFFYNQYGELMNKGVKTFTFDKYAQIKTTVSTRSFQVTTLSAASGAVTIGAGGGMMGMTAGAGVGAAVGVVPAIFTFGLSIPVGAFMGGAFGLCAGTVVGGSTGLVGGGAAGYYGYERRHEIKGAAKGVSDKANACATAVKERALASKNFAISFVSGTGGTHEKSS